MGHIVKTIFPRTLKHHVEYRRDFSLKKDHSAGYAFPCDVYGNLQTDDVNYDVWYPNYIYCVQHPELYEDNGVVKEEWDYTEPEVVQCSCGTTLYLDGDISCPKCGQWYNGFGQSLKDPSQWGDEDMF